MGIFNILGAKKKLKINIYNSDNDASINIPYRLKDDPENLIRIRQDYPLKSSNKWDTVEEYWGLHVAGVTYREQSVLSFIGGENREIELIQEPTSKYPHAIAVYGQWEDNNRHRKEQLGYVPDEDARDIYKHIKNLRQYMLSAKLYRMFIPTERKNPGLMIDILINT